MKFFLAVIIIVGCVIGGYALSNGSVGALWHPFELLMIFGGGAGIYVMSNTPSVLKETVLQMKFVLSPPVSKKKFIESIRVMDKLTQTYFQGGGKQLEAELDDPETSSAFQGNNTILKDSKITKFISDNFSLVTNNNFNAHELSDYLDEEIDRYHKEMMGPSHALDELGDTMPGLGIVVAVLGIIIAMGYINEEPAILGYYISAALFGTFAGIFAGYGLFKPVAAFLRNIGDEQLELYKIMKLYIISVSERNKAPGVVMEIAHKLLPPHYRITLEELKE